MIAMAGVAVWLTAWRLVNGMVALTPRGRLGPFADGWIDAVNTPRYARIHAQIRFRLRRPPSACSLPARPTEETIEFRAGRLPQILTFSRYGK